MAELSNVPLYVVHVSAAEAAEAIGQAQSARREGHRGNVAWFPGDR